MSDFMDVLSFKEKKAGGWRVVRLGYAKPSDKGGMDVYLDALPTDGRLSIRPQRDSQQRADAAKQQPNEPDDEIPF